MNQRYRWLSTTPSESLAIKLTNIEEEERVFHAVLQHVEYRFQQELVSRCFSNSLWKQRK